MRSISNYETAFLQIAAALVAAGSENPEHVVENAKAITDAVCAALDNRRRAAFASTPQDPLPALLRPQAE